jgi:hypothetical protein
VVCYSDLKALCIVTSGRSQSAVTVHGIMFHGCLLDLMLSGL